MPFYFAARFEFREEIVKHFSNNLIGFWRHARKHAPKTINNFYKPFKIPIICSLLAGFQFWTLHQDLPFIIMFYKYLQQLGFSF